MIGRRLTVAAHSGGLLKSQWCPSGDRSVFTFTRQCGFRDHFTSVILHLRLQLSLTLARFLFLFCVGQLYHCKKVICFVHKVHVRT